jgi:tetratricopeptide (TPR) repeat protein
VAILADSVGTASAQAGAIYLARSLALHEDGRFDEARPFAVLAVQQFDTRDADWQDLAGALNQLAALEIDLGNHVGAEPVLRRAIALHTANGEREVLGLAALYNNLAVALASQPDRLEEAAQIYAEAARLVESVGVSAPRLATLLANQANVYRMLGRYGESEATFDRAISLLRGSLGPDHQSTLTAATSLASLYESTGEFQKAAETLRAPLASARATLPADHPTTAYIQGVLGSALCQMDGGDRLEEGLSLAQASAEARRTALGAEHWAVASAESVVGYCMLRLGRREPGKRLLERAVETLRTERGEEQELTLRAKRWLNQVKE